MIHTLAITGYKSHELGIFQPSHPAISIIKKSIERNIRSFVEEGLEWVVISGQLGVELWAAEVVIDLKEEFHDLKLAVLLPFVEQEKNWNEENKHLFEEILINADYVNAITNRPYESPAQFRLKNEFIIQKSDGLLLVYDEEKEGTPKFMFQRAKKEQEKRNYLIQQITFYDLQLMVEETQWNQS